MTNMYMEYTQDIIAAEDKLASKAFKLVKQFALQYELSFMGGNGTYTFNAHPSNIYAFLDLDFLKAFAPDIYKLCEYELDSRCCLGAILPSITSSVTDSVYLHWNYKDNPYISNEEIDSLDVDCKGPLSRKLALAIVDASNSIDLFDSF